MTGGVRLGCTRQALSRLLNGRDFAVDGPGAGANRLEQREFLDAAAGGLRTGAGTASAGGLTEGYMTRVIFDVC